MTYAFSHRHVLDDHILGFETRRNLHHLSVLRRPTILTALCHDGTQEDVRLALDLMEDVSIRQCSFAEWFIVSQAIAPELLLRQILDIPGLSAFDNSDGRVLMQICGPQVRRILAKCLAVDLHPDVFAIGRSANMLIGQVSGNLAHTQEDVFELIVPRSQAGFVFEHIKEMGREFALTAGFAEA